MAVVSRERLARALAHERAFLAGTRDQIRFHYAGARIAIACGAEWDAELQRIGVTPKVPD